MHRLTLSLLFAILAVSSAVAQEEDLKRSAHSRSPLIVELLTAGVLTEGMDGLLKPAGQLEPAHSQAMQAENQDRSRIFALIAEKTKMPPEDVAALYSQRARAKFPAPLATASAFGPCKLTPAKTADVSRLLQYLKQGMIFAGQRKFSQALAEFQPALAIDRNFLSLNQNVGAAHLGLRKYADAESAFNAELKLIECLSPLNDAQLATFGYFFEVDERDPAKRKKLQAEKLKAELPVAKAAANYNLACVHSQQKQKDPGLLALRAAVDSGFKDKAALNADPDLAFLRQSPEFKQILSDIK